MKKRLKEYYQNYYLLTQNIKALELVESIDNINISNVDHCLWIQNFVRAFPDNRFIFSCEEKFYLTYTL